MKDSQPKQSHAQPQATDREPVVANSNIFILNV